MIPSVYLHKSVLSYAFGDGSSFLPNYKDLNLKFPMSISQWSSLRTVNIETERNDLFLINTAFLIVLLDRGGTHGIVSPTPIMVSARLTKNRTVQPRK